MGRSIWFQNDVYSKATFVWLEAPLDLDLFLFLTEQLLAGCLMKGFLSFDKAGRATYSLLKCNPGYKPAQSAHDSITKTCHGVLVYLLYNILHNSFIIYISYT